MSALKKGRVVVETEKTLLSNPGSLIKLSPDAMKKLSQIATSIEKISKQLSELNAQVQRPTAKKSGEVTPPKMRR